MSDKRKTYVVVTLSKGEKKLRSLSKEDAWKAALARGWRPIEIYPKKEELKKAA